jgi:hypothetical protein
MLASHMMTAAGLLALVSSIGMGFMTSERLQVGLYGAGLTGLDAMKAGMPAWLVSKGDLDTPIEFLTEGPVADSVIAATMAATELEERVKPRLELVRQMREFATALEEQQQNLRMAALTAWQSLEGSEWRKRYVAGLERRRAAAEAHSEVAGPSMLSIGGPSAAQVVAWNERNRTVARRLAANLTRLAEGDLDEMLWAVGSKPLTATVSRLRAQFRDATERGDLGFPVTISPTGALTVPAVEPGLATDFATIEVALGTANLTVVRRVLEVAEYRLKEIYVVAPRLLAVRAAISHEQALNSYREYTDWERARIDKAARAGAHLPQGSPAAEKFQEFLTALQRWGYDFPEDIGRKVPGLRHITKRELARLLAIEQFRRAPNRWVTLFVVSVFLGVTGFFVGVGYSVAFIVNMGILGTARNLVGIAYVRSEGAFRRAQLEEGQRLLALQHSAHTERPKIADLSPGTNRQIRDVSALTNTD